MRLRIYRGCGAVIRHVIYIIITQSDCQQDVLGMRNKLSFNVISLFWLIADSNHNWKWLLLSVNEPHRGPILVLPTEFHLAKLTASSLTILYYSKLYLIFHEFLRLK